MKKYIELDSAPYWDAAVEQEVKNLRREQGRQAAESMTNLAVFLVLLFVALFAYSRGYLDNLDVVGTLDWIGQSVSVFLNNVSNLLKDYFAG
jgi:hypothetical protein